MTVHRIKLSDFKDKKRDEGAIEIELDDGNAVRVDPPELWGDDVMRLAEAGDNVGAARLLVEDYDAFLAAGGSSAILYSIVEEVHGSSVPESQASARS